MLIWQMIICVALSIEEKKKADFHSEKRYKTGTGNDERMITFLWWVNLEWPTV